MAESSMMSATSSQMVSDYEICSNNVKAILDFNKYNSKYHIVIEFLRHHFIHEALTLEANCPVIYLQHFWKNVTVEKDKDESFLKSDLRNEFNVTVYKSHIRKLLGFPKSKNYDPNPTSDEIMLAILELGYNEQLRILSKFKRKALPHIWGFLFSMVNRCLTGKKGSMDQGNYNVLAIFYGLFKNRNLDYAQLIFDGMVAAVKKKEGFIPYIRSFSIILAEVLKNEDVSHLQMVKKFKTALFMPITIDANFQHIARLSDEMLSYIPKESEILKSYLGDTHNSEPSEAFQSLSQSLSPLLFERRGEGVNLEANIPRATTSTIKGSRKPVDIEEEPSPGSFVATPASHSYSIVDEYVSDSLKGEPGNLSSPNSLGVDIEARGQSSRTSFDFEQDFEPEHVSTHVDSGRHQFVHTKYARSGFIPSGLDSLPNKHVVFVSEPESDSEAHARIDVEDEPSGEPQGSSRSPDEVNLNTASEAGPADDFVSNEAEKTDNIEEIDEMFRSEHVMSDDFLKKTEFKEEIQNLKITLLGSLKGALNAEFVTKSDLKNELNELRSTILDAIKERTQPENVSTSEFKEEMKSLKTRILEAVNAGSQEPQQVRQDIMSRSELKVELESLKFSILESLKGEKPTVFAISRKLDAIRSSDPATILSEPQLFAISRKLDAISESMKNLNATLETPALDKVPQYLETMQEGIQKIVEQMRKSFMAVSGDISNNVVAKLITGDPAIEKLKLNILKALLKIDRQLEEQGMSIIRSKAELSEQVSRLKAYMTKRFDDRDTKRGRRDQKDQRHQLRLVMGVLE